MCNVPILTIIIPYYSNSTADRTRQIKRMLASIPDAHDIEVIIVDDMSTPPLELVSPFRYASYKMERMSAITVFAGAARNLGLKLATGTYFLCADSDDYFETTGLLKVLDRLREAPLPQSTVVHLLRPIEIYADESQEAKTLYEHVFRAHSPTDPARTLTKWHAPWAKIISRNAIQRGVAFKENHISDDLEFSVRLALVADEVHLHDIHGYNVVRAHGQGAITSNVRRKDVRARIEAYREANALLRDGGRPDLIIPMHHVFRKYFRHAPFSVLDEIATTISRRERLIPGSLTRR